MHYEDSMKTFHAQQMMWNQKQELKVWETLSQIRAQENK